MCFCVGEHMGASVQRSNSSESHKPGATGACEMQRNEF